MIQSILRAEPARPRGLHVAIIMDGNGRWAVRQGRPRSAGHRMGARAVRRIVETAPELGIGALTLYAFSSDNWRRSGYEVRALMRLLQVYLHSEIDTCLANDIRLSVIGRRDRLPRAVQAAVARAEEATAHGRLLHLRLAIDYSSREAVVRAAGRLAPTDEPSCETFARLLGEAIGADAPAPDVDLLIRTGGEQRLSDFLLWECAYAELIFTPRLWPDFTPADLQAAVREFQGRERRFGGVPEAVPV